MAKIPQPTVSRRVVLLAVFALALVLLLTQTWQLAFLAGFVAGMLSPRARRAALFGAAGVAIAWTAYLVYLFALLPAQALSSLFVSILGLDAGLWWLLPFLTILLGALVGLAGALTGHTAANLFLWSEPASEAPKA